jgi:hypothetical protein
MLSCEDRPFPDKGILITNDHIFVGDDVSFSEHVKVLRSIRGGVYLRATLQGSTE